MAWVRALRVKSVFVLRRRSMTIPVLFCSLNSMAEEKVLLDSGATSNFIDHRIIKRLKLPLCPLPTPIVVRNIDGTKNKAGRITHYVNLVIRQGQKEKAMKFHVTHLGDDSLILGYPWFETFNPTINWKEGTMKDSPIHLCTPKANRLSILPAQRRVGGKRRPLPKLWKGEQIVAVSFHPERIAKTTIATELAAKKVPKDKKPWTELIPQDYHRHRSIFSEEEAKRFPPS
jgi:gag-polyprotein putative aspartyl protease